MSTFALTLVITSALLHATWNLLAKQAGGGALLIWLFSFISASVLLPVILLLTAVGYYEFNTQQVAYIVATGILHLIYFLLLQRGYASGDLSLVYPLARGLAPTLTTFGAVLFLHEHPTRLAFIGLGLVVAGVALLTFHPRRGHSAKPPRAAIVYGVLIGVSISAYSVLDKYTVDDLEVSPFALEAGADFLICLALTPNAVARWPQVKQLWREHTSRVLGVTILAPASYLLILTAMRYAPVSTVAPCREISILFAALMGAHILGEGHNTRRLAAAASMVAGVVCLALAKTAA